MKLRSNNPVFKRVQNSDYVMDTDVATYRGVASKVGFYILMVVLGAVGGLVLSTVAPDAFIVLVTVSAFTTFIFGLIALMSPRLAKVMGTLYSLLQGVLVGVISMAFNDAIPGTVFVAIASTIVVLVVIATLFLTNIVKVNGKFMRFLTTFSISVLIGLLFVWLLSITIYRNVEFNLGFNLIVSIIMIFLATLYLLFDFENIRQVVEGGAPKNLEWYVAFGLVFTIVWLYMEILPLVARLLARRD